MKKVINRILFWLNLVGVDLLRFTSIFKGSFFYFNDYSILRRQMKNKSDFVFWENYPILNERYCEGGTANGHYFHMDLLIARIIFENKPIRHIDIGSRIDGFDLGKLKFLISGQYKTL
jgi:hypothetical protein